METNLYSRVLSAGVMELVDVADSKSADGDIVWVRVPPPAPLEILRFPEMETWVFFLSPDQTVAEIPGLMRNACSILSADRLLDLSSRCA